MGRLREAATGFAFTMILGLIGFGVVFGISALFDLPWLVNVLGGRPIELIGSLFLLVLLGLVAFVVWLVRKIRERQRHPAE
ncbi:hypothetical protein [Streptosporangium minutum]|uniref:Uncharacterized protein n=1 Tax=Streptosporangium minutum TaxID=569862 RepID=A0A243RM69_9ACTN|nr:hypothetical protein [Streptosporangium minutum]OUC96043.1 hypothetical protein CA984_16320 [Streptosporangium minutum]